MSASGPRRRTPAALVGATALILTAAFGAAGTAHAAKPAKPARTVDLQLLSFNDFHGQIEEPTGSSANVRTGTNDTGGAVNTITGGAEYLGTHLEALRKPHSLTVAAGDLIGASPLLSAAFHDEPTIETMNAIGLDVSSVGNHEFDEGSDELLRMQNGGCLDDGVDGLNNQNSCPIPGHEFAGADFQYLSANVFHHNSDNTLFPPSWVRTVAGVKVGFIGMTLEDTPSIVTPTGVAGLDFKDEVETANALVPKLQAQGVQSIVVLLHEGGFPASGVTWNTCPGISGPVVDIAENLSPAIDAVLTGHTHQAYNCLIDDPANNPRIVTSAASFGRIITEVNLKLDVATGDVIRSESSATNHLVTRDVPKDPAVTSIRSAYDSIIAPVRDRVVGSAAVTLTRTTATKPEADLGDAIADAQLASTAPADKGGAQIAFMNAGGVRADLEAGPVTYGDAFNVQPFANILTTVTLKGSDIKEILEQQFYTVDKDGIVSSRFLQPSSGFTYTWTNTAAAGSRVTDMMLNGEPINPDTSYQVTASNFLTSGGDGFTKFLNGTGIIQGPIDLDSFVDYLAAHDPIGVPAGYPRINLNL
jgi:5'-nucleotidase